MTPLVMSYDSYMQLDVASRKLPIIAVTDAKLAASLEKHITDLHLRVQKELAGMGGR